MASLCVVNTVPWQVVTLIAGSKCCHLLMTGDYDEMFMTRSLNVMSKTIEERLVARTICDTETNY